MGCHLRFGFEATYGKDAVQMRDDNAADYPWLRYALITLLTELNTSVGEPMRGRILEAIVGGLSADPVHFMRDPEFLERFAPHRAAVLQAFDTYAPTDAAYSPQSLFFNFSHNVLKGAVVDAMLWGEPWPVTLNDLLTSYAFPASSAAPIARRQALAATLMDYARKNPHRIRGRLMPVIVYDPATGRRVLQAARVVVEGR